MAIARILGFEHLPQGTEFGTAPLYYAQSCFGLGAGDLGASCQLDSKGGWPPLSLYALGNKIAVGRHALGSSGVSGYSTIPLSSFTKETNAKKIIIGFRFELTRTPSQSLPVMVIGERSAAAETSLGNGYGRVQNVNWVSTTDAVGKMFYMEAVFDFERGVFYSITDGAKGAESSLGTLTAANFKNHFWGIGRNDVPTSSPSTVTTINYFLISDVYCIVDTGDEEDPYRGPLGPINVKRIPIASAAGEWTPSGASDLKASLSTNKTANNNLNTPIITNNTDTAELKIKLNTSGFAEGKLKAIDAVVGCFKESGVAGGISAKWKMGDKVGIPGAVNVPLASTMPPEQRLPMPTSISNKLEFSQANLAALELIVTPT